MSKKQEKGTDMNEQEMQAELDEQAVSGANLPIEEQTVDETSSFVKELEEQKEKYIRLLAEFENYKRRTSKERIEFIKAAGQDVIKELLPALDDIDRAKSVIEEAKDIQAVKEGIQLINEKIYQILTAKGLKEIDCIEKDFDVESMESITEVPAPTEKLKGKVVDVVEKGYTL
ncbi:MAG: nucleotide exchange factor GrpE, partial [Chitinophagales bacterium]